MNTWEEKNGLGSLLPGGSGMVAPLNRLIEWRAQRIVDPLERLKFLRHATSSSMALQATLLRPRRWQMAAGGLLFAMITISAFTLARQPSTAAASLPDRLTTQGGVRLMPKVWLVETKQDSEVYSNGLRIENKYAIGNEPRRSYPAYARRDAKDTPMEWRTQPSGIVFHTTESLQLPFEQSSTKAIQRVDVDVLGMVRQNRSYHFMIDKFGQVYRLVKESDVAYHAGFSVWGDERAVFVNLNNSFLSIAIETHTRPDQETPTATAAQIHSARVLTQMLRSKYQIPASDCVTHAQVSVNPDNKLLGFHTDWAGNFPFTELGLGDNYLEPSAAIDTFGFTYDSTLVQATGSRYWQGLILAEEQMRAQAMNQGLSQAEYRKILQDKYTKILRAVRGNTVEKEKSNEN
jgi:N-acetylmuramoyl-L-alanine amidase